LTYLQHVRDPAHLGPANRRCEPEIAVTQAPERGFMRCELTDFGERFFNRIKRRRPIAKLAAIRRHHGYNRKLAV